MALLSRLFGSKQGATAVRVLPADIAFTAQPKRTVLQAALDAGLAYPHQCRVGSCGTCKTRLVSGSVRELTDKSYILSDQEMRDGVILACQSIPKSDLVIDNPSLRADHVMHEVSSSVATITAIAAMTHDIIRLDCALDQPIAYLAGQYAELTTPDGESRHFSFVDPPATAPDVTTTARFYIRRVPGGAFTGHLFDHAKPGDKLTLRAPYGGFYLRPGAAPILAIAGGSGLGPILAMLEQARAERLARDAIILFGARTQSDLYALERIEALSRIWIARLRLFPILSAEPAHSSWSGARGFIHDWLTSANMPDLAEHHAYLCGPPAMIDATTATLRASGIDARHIHADAFTDRSSLTANAA